MKNKDSKLKLKDRIAGIIEFLTFGIWHVKTKNRPKHEFFLITVLRIIILSLKEFNKDLCQLRASALTFYTLLSVVPVLALAFGIAKGFKIDTQLRNQLLNAFDAKIVVSTNVVSDFNIVTNYTKQVENQKPKMFVTYNYALKTNAYDRVVPAEATNEEINAKDRKFASQYVILGKVLNFVDNALQNVNGGIIAGIGIAILFWSVIKVLGQVEHSFNAIWGVKKARHLGRKITDYLSVMILAPVLLVMSNGINILIKSRLNQVFDQFQFLAVFQPVLKLLSIVTIWVLFAFIYVFMPNTKVKFSSAIIAGVVAGTIFNLMQWFYIAFQVGVAKYSAIYGSFAALPLFLAWMQISWIIVLYGSELAFAYQNVDTYEFEPGSMKISYSFKKLLILLTAHNIIQRFINGDEPLSDSELSKNLDMPVRLTRDILDELSEAGVICKVMCEERKKITYNPAIDVNKLTIGYILQKIDEYGDDSFPVCDSEAIHKLSNIISDFQNVINSSPENIKLADV